MTTTTTEHDAECVACGKPFASFGPFPICETCTRRQAASLPGLGPRKPNTATIIVDVPDDWYKTITTWPDIFGAACGYWARGVARAAVGWLVYEHNDCRREEEPNREEAERVFRDGGGDLPPGWHVWDRAFAEKAYTCGVKRYGEKKMQCADSAQTDIAVQLALFGEVRYG